MSLIITILALGMKATGLSLPFAPVYSGGFDEIY